MENFIKKVREFLAGEPILLTELIDWLGNSQPINYKKHRLGLILDQLQKEIFSINIDKYLLQMICPEGYDYLSNKSMLACYDTPDIRDWKFAVSGSSKDPSLLSYMDYKNAEKYRVLVRFDKEREKIAFIIDGVEKDSLIAFPKQRIKGKPTSVLKETLEFLFYYSTKKLQNAIDAVAYFYSGDGDSVIFREVSGEEIRWAYHEDNYAQPQNNGTLWSSCLRYEDRQKLLQIYCDNPQVVGLLVALDECNRVLGRTLLWQPETGKKYFDTIYAYNSRVLFQMLNHLSKRDYQPINAHRVSVNLKHSKYRYLPYLDNMHYFTDYGLQNFEDRNVICKYKSLAEEHFLKSDLYKKVEGGLYYHIEELYYCNYLQRYVHNAVEAYYKNTSSDWFPANQVSYSKCEKKNIYIASRYVTYLDYCQDYAFTEYCVEDIDGILRHYTHVIFSDEMRGYIMKESAVRHEKLGWVTKDVFEKYQTTCKHG